MTTKVHPLHPPRFTPQVYFLLVATLCVNGLATSIYLAIAHYRNYTDISYQSFCAISRSINCDTVAQSSYALFFEVPMAAWGGLGYFFFLALLFLSFHQKKVQCITPLFFLAGLFSLISIALAVVSIRYIHSYCLLCIVTYAINFSLFATAWMAVNRFGAGSFRTTFHRDLDYLIKKWKQVGTLLLCCMLASFSAVAFYPRYWVLTAQPLDAKVRFGTTEDGSPWIGAQTPSLTIIEYADYLCFQCGKMQHHLRQLINQYPDQIRLIHRHYPLDDKVNPAIKETIHSNSGMLSFFAIMAQQQNLFWQVNDALFREARSKQTISLSAIAKETGMDLSQFQEKLDSPELHQLLAKDIQSGLQHNITATPSYVVDDKVYSGTLPWEIIEAALKKTP